MLRMKRSDKRRNKALTLVEVLISIGIFMTTSAVLLASLQQYHKTMQEVQKARVMNALLHQTVWNVMKLKDLPPLPFVGIFAQRDVNQVIAGLE
ncbi:MAG: type II secretion system protein, partial [Armatimonadetes bacterium]|nr:type II secretion system protein [Armatimonadota bacterium]